MNQIPEVKKWTKVISQKNLPMRCPALWLVAIYHLYDLAYSFPLWVDVVMYSLLIIWFVCFVALNAQQVSVDIFKE